MHKNRKLESIIYSSFLKASLFPILIIELMLLFLYFGINKYISDKNLNTLLYEAKKDLYEISKSEVKSIDNQLQHINKLSILLQKEHEHFFKNPKAFGLPNGKPSFSVAKNGVFYKTNKVGSSLYYSSHTKIGEKEYEKALKTEFMDINFKNIVDINDNIVAAYLNTWDNMNRLYPFIDDVAEQYGPHINMEDFNFYYLADAKHNPKREPVWTGAYLDPAGNGWMVSCVVPIYNNDFLEGVTGLDVTIDSFVKNILNLQLSWDAKAFLVDNDGMILAMPNDIEEKLGIKTIKEKEKNKKITTTITKPEDFNILKSSNDDLREKLNNLSEQSNIIEFKNANKEYLLTRVKVLTTNWELMVLVSKDKILKPINELKQISNNIGYLAIFFMIVFYILFFIYLLKKSKRLSYEIAKPIVDLTKYISQIGKNKDINKDELHTEIEEIDFIAKANSDIQNLNREFYETNLKLDDMNKNLESKIKEEINKNRQKEAILIQQSKMAAMGEILSSIIHQWKQPLNVISMASSSLELKNSIGQGNDKDIHSTNNIIKKQINLMNQTMNDFRNFFRPSPREVFKASSLIYSCYELISEIFKSKGINININILEDNDCCGYKNELMQVILNILNNARDAILDNNSKYKDIEIDLSFDRNKNMALIEIKDLAGGINEDVVEKIFEPYFTTKDKNKGTGIGLYMSKTIVEKSNGELKAENYIKEILDASFIGANFKLYLALKSD